MTDYLKTLRQKAEAADEPWDIKSKDLISKMVVTKKDAALIAACNPKTVLWLLDTLEFVENKLYDIVISQMGNKQRGIPNIEEVYAQEAIDKIKELEKGPG